MTFINSQWLIFLISSGPITKQNATKSDGTSADDAKVKSDLFDLVEKLQIELQVKDQELAKEKMEKQKLSIDLELEKVRANEEANRADELETELASAHETNAALQKILWRSFPTEDFFYYIKVKPGTTENVQYRYLHVDNSGHLRFGFSNRSVFEFTKNSNDTFSIFSITKGKHLQTQSSSFFSRVSFSATDENNAGQFVLFFHQQNREAGLLVDISTLAGSFMCLDDENFVVANSSDVPTNKFLIIPVEEDD